MNIQSGGFIISVLLLLDPLLTASAQEKQGEELLDYLIQKNELAMQRSASGRIDYEWVGNSFLDLRGRRVFYEKTTSDRSEDHINVPTSVDKGTGVLIFDGSKRYELGTSRRHLTKAGTDRENTLGIVVNDEYFGSWSPHPIHQMQRYDHESIEQMSKMGKAHLTGSWPPNILTYGFGTGVETLREAVSSDRELGEWKATEETLEDGHSVFKVRKSASLRSPAIDLIIDPEKGFLVTRYVSYDRKGDIFLERTIRAKQLENGDWFPEVLTETRLQHEIVLTVTRFELDVPVESNQFTLAALGLREGTLISQYSPDGNHDTLVFEGGQVVPRR